MIVRKNNRQDDWMIVHAIKTKSRKGWRDDDICHASWNNHGIGQRLTSCAIQQCVFGPQSVWSRSGNNCVTTMAFYTCVLYLLGCSSLAPAVGVTAAEVPRTNEVHVVITSLTFRAFSQNKLILFIRNGASSVILLFFFSEYLLAKIATQHTQRKTCITRSFPIFEFITLFVIQRQRATLSVAR